MRSTRRKLGEVPGRLPLVVALTSFMLLAGGAGAALAAGTDTVTFSETGEHAIVVPPGVSSLHVVAIGGRGGSYEGGFGGKVTGDLSVTPGTPLYVEVGGNGGSEQLERGPYAGGGGGASDIRTRPWATGLSPTDPRLLVAGGGGGEGAVFGPGGLGGDVGMPGEAGGGDTARITGGAAGGPAGGGVGGVGVVGEEGDGGAGGLGYGGGGGYLTLAPERIEWHGAYGGYNGGGSTGGYRSLDIGYEVLGGGGGGGGWYGGGGGAGVLDTPYNGNPATYNTAAAGGGGGSDHVPPGGTATIDTTGVPGVTVSFQDSVAPAMSLAALPEATKGVVTVKGSSGTQLGDGSVKIEVFKGSAASGALLLSETAERDATTGSWERPIGTFADGQYTVRGTQVDGGGNVSPAVTETFIYDSTAPVPSLSSPAVGADTNSPLPTFRGIAGTAPRDEAAVEVTVRDQDDQVVATGSGTRDGASGAYAVTTTTPIPDGIYTASTTQSDSVGNSGTSSPTTFFVDTVPPTLTMAPPPAASNDPTPTLEGSGGTAPFDIRVVDVRIYAGTTPNGSSLRTFHKNLDEAGNYQVTAAALPDGIYTAQASEVDAAGNSGTSPARTFTIDTTTPTVTLTSPTTGSQSSGDPAFAGVGGTAPGDPGTVTVIVRRGNSTEGPSVERVAAPLDAGSGAYSVSSPETLPAGTYTAVVEQTDEVGNTGRSTAGTFTVVAAPVPAPAGGAGTGGGAVAGESAGTSGGAGTGAAAGTGAGAIRPARCVVPKLIAKKLKAAETALDAAGCKIGKLTRSKGSQPNSSEVLKQSPKPGTVLAARAAVRVTLG
jgi:Bacterial Ig-like domain/PASTA domain